MGEYARINEGYAFWLKYQREIHNVDAGLVVPVLESMGATARGPKFLSDANYYRSGVGAKEYEFVFDVRDDESQVVDVGVYRTRGDDRVRLGHVAVQLPCSAWEAARQQLKELL